MTAEPFKNHRDGGMRRRFSDYVIDIIKRSEMSDSLKELYGTHYWDTDLGQRIENFVIIATQFWYVPTRSSIRFPTYSCGWSATRTITISGASLLQAMIQRTVVYSMFAQGVIVATRPRHPDRVVSTHNWEVQLPEAGRLFVYNRSGEKWGTFGKGRCCGVLVIDRGSEVYDATNYDLGLHHHKLYDVMLFVPCGPNQMSWHFFCAHGIAKPPECDSIEVRNALYGSSDVTGDLPSHRDWAGVGPCAGAAQRGQSASVDATAVISNVYEGDGPKKYTFNAYKNVETAQHIFPRRSWR